jgi:hypothetical protein
MKRYFDRKLVIVALLVLLNSYVMVTRTTNVSANGELDCEVCVYPTGGICVACDRAPNGVWAQTGCWPRQEICECEYADWSWGCKYID